MASSLRQAVKAKRIPLELTSRCLSTTARQAADAQANLLGTHLKDADPQIYEILQKEKQRQRHFINLIPSENFTSLAVLDALGSVMQSESILSSRPDSR